TRSVPRHRAGRLRGALMLTLLKTLPAIGVLVIGLLGGGALSGAGFWAWSMFVEGPRVALLEKAATDRANDACTIRTQAAADSAATAERVRQAAVSEDALATYRGAADQQAAARQAAEDKLS